MYSTWHSWTFQESLKSRQEINLKMLKSKFVRCALSSSPTLTRLYLQSLLRIRTSRIVMVWKSLARLILRACARSESSLKWISWTKALIARISSVYEIIPFVIEQTFILFYLFIIDNRVIPLRKGYVAVVNRSQRDIQNDLPVKLGLKQEMEFFQSHPKYRNMLSRCGTRNLAKILNQILMAHIRECLPEIKTRIARLLLNVQNNLTGLGA